MDLRFELGQMVRLRADPSRVGMIMAVTPRTAGVTYVVFFGANDIAHINESMLEPTEADDGGSANGYRFVTRDQFLRALLLAKLDTPINDLLYAFQGSRTQFEPYQFKPVLKFLDSPVPGILIADEVGLGKTIEAAIILQELRAREAVRRVLVVCPAGLREKWQAELLNRFDESFQIMFSREVEHDIRLYRQTDGAHPLNGIVSLETFRLPRLQNMIVEEGVTYDLGIIDEAHHLRTGGTLSNRVGDRMQELCEHLVLLTATPLQTSQDDLYNLLRFVDPSQFSDRQDFTYQLQPNALLNEAISALRQQPPDAVGARRSLGSLRSFEAGAQVTRHPKFPLIMRALDGDIQDREVLVRLRRDIDSLNVLAPIYTRTVKRDVSGAAERSAVAVNVDVTKGEADFLAAVLAYARAQARQKSGKGWAPGFVGIMRERQAASCITAMREYLEETINARQARKPAPELQVEATDVDVEPEGQSTRTLSVAATEIALRDAAQALGSTDSKLARFLETLREVLGENGTSKIIVFTFFRRTLAYLEQALREADVQVTSIHGDVKPQERAQRIGRFREDAQTRVLLTTEVGSEGLDFQFCDTLFNYDLPWNPMRVEQRIGRIDRYGQRARKVRIYSFFLRGTIEERILQRLYTRIGIFTESIGDLEPILGPISAELTKDVFTSDLTPDEEGRVAEKYEQMIVNRRVTKGELERDSSKLLGQDMLLLQAVDDNVRSGRYVSASELHATVAGFLSEVFGADLISRNGDEPSVVVPAAGDLRRRTLEHLRKTNDTRPVATEFLHKVTNGVRVAATFEGETALRSPLLELLNLRHPLVQMAVSHYRDQATGGRALPVASLVLDPGWVTGVPGLPSASTVGFYLVLLSVTGAIRATRLVPFVFGFPDGTRVPGLEEVILRLVQEDAADARADGVSAEMLAQLDLWAIAAAAEYSDKVLAESVARNDATIAVRRTTLERTYNHRISKRRALLAAASDLRIQRLRSGEIAHLEAELRSKIEEVESRREVGVTFTPVAAGILEFRGSSESSSRDTARTVGPQGDPASSRPAENSAHDDVMALLGGHARRARS